MNQADVNRKVCLTIPADQAYAPVASLALSGLGMIANLDVDLLGDLRTVTAEAMDCLLHQSRCPQRIEICAGLENGSLCICFTALERECAQDVDALDIEITRGVLETLMPQVTLKTDDEGVYGIHCAMPV